MDAGADTNANGTLDDAEIAVTSYVCNGAAGASSLVRTAAEPAGGNCIGGGFRIQSGSDDDNNGTLDDAEVTMTTYACIPVPAPRSACDDARPLVEGVTSGDLSDREDTFLGCRTSGVPGALRMGEGTPDQAWSLYVARRARISVYARGRELALYLRRGVDCAASALVYGACSDASSADGEVLTQVLDPGQYWVIVEGTATAGGDYDIHYRVEDPCDGDLAYGRCEGPASVRWCIVPPAGVRNPQTASLACPAGESCRTVDGAANCFLDRVTTTCPTPGYVCRDANTLIRCDAPGAPTVIPCTNGCKETQSGGMCLSGDPTTRFSAQFSYEYREPNAELSDWGSETLTAPLPGAMVVSWHWDGTQLQWLDDTVTDPEGNYTVDVVDPPDPQDLVIVYAAYPRLLGGGAVAFAVATPAVPTGTQPVATVVDGVTYSWSVAPYDHGSGRTYVITEALGSAAARVFDGMRVVFQNTAQLYYRGSYAQSLVVWLKTGTSWSCGECLWASPTPALGGFDTQMFINGSASDAQYWADAVTFHEIGHWVMASFGQSPGEGGTHWLGVPYFPGMAWSEGFATWLSSDWRADTRYIDKQGGSMFWLDLNWREHGSGSPWLRPVPADGLFQRMYENEVSATLWTLSSNPTVGPNPVYWALNSVRAQAPTRGYTRRTWDVDAQGEPINVVDTREPAVMFADFLDALVCSASPADIATHVDAAVEPSAYYPYNAASAVCP